MKLLYRSSMKCTSSAALTSSFCEKEGVDIRLNTRVTREYAEKEAPDAIIVAAGSEPLVPPIPGLREAEER